MEFMECISTKVEGNATNRTVNLHNSLCTIIHIETVLIDNGLKLMSSGG